jgi:TfoX/Sxy family transcriptional regulator of competence genes
MKFEKADPSIVKLFNEIAHSSSEKKGVEERKMFGYPCRFVNGNMYMGLHNNNMILRLSEKDRIDFLKLGARLFEPMPGRIMKEYVEVPKEMMIREEDKSTNDLKAWIDKSLSYAMTLAPKKKSKADKEKKRNEEESP